MKYLLVLCLVIISITATAQLLTEKTKDSLIQITCEILRTGNDNNCLYGDVFMKDELFNGQTKKIKFYINTYSIQPYPDYNYRITAAAAESTQGNPFAEPNNVYTNVRNGRGIFSISILHIVEIK